MFYFTMQTINGIHDNMLMMFGDNSSWMNKKLSHALINLFFIKHAFHNYTFFLLNYVSFLSPKYVSIKIKRFLSIAFAACMLHNVAYHKVKSISYMMMYKILTHYHVHSIEMFWCENCVFIWKIHRCKRMV